MNSREPYRPVLTTDADVTTMWQALINPLGWHNARMYLMIIDASHRPTPVVTEIDEIPDHYTGEDAHALMRLYGRLIAEHAPGGSVAVLVCRPGAPLLTDADRAWCGNLYAAGRDAELPLELVHLGTDTAIVPVPMDEVLPRSA